MTKRKSVKYVYVLRTCNADMTSYGGFKWPKKGKVEAKDWEPTYVCGNGLHGLLWGTGDAGLLNTNTDAQWLVVKVNEADLLHGKGDLVNKCKFKRGTVVFVGSRFDATAEIVRLGANPATCVYYTATAGYEGTATAGDWGTATAGDGGTATAGDWGTILISWWDGNRKRVVTGYVGEAGIKADRPYRLNAKHELEAVKS